MSEQWTVKPYNSVTNDIYGYGVFNFFLPPEGTRCAATFHVDLLPDAKERADLLAAELNHKEVG